jgi:hypothetical protein
MPELTIDHLVYATPDLEQGVRGIEELLGVTASPGGQHLGVGTRNALVSLGPGVYLEIIGPDPAQPAPKTPRPFGIDELREPRLVTWAARTRDIEAAMAAARAEGVDLGAIRPMSRVRPDGVTLSWRSTDTAAPRAGGVVPFLIDWGPSPHPAAALPPGCTLVELSVSHPDADNVRRRLRALGFTFTVQQRPEPRLSALIRSPNGDGELV